MVGAARIQNVNERVTAWKGFIFVLSCCRRLLALIKDIILVQAMAKDNINGIVTNWGNCDCELMVWIKRRVCSRARVTEGAVDILGS